MNKMVDKKTKRARTAFVYLVAVALAVAGTCATGLASLNGNGSIGYPKVAINMAQGIPVMPSLKYAHNKVTTDRNSAGNHHTCIILPLILKTDNHENRFKTQNVSCRETDVSSIHERERFSVMTSTSLISAHLGRRLTLVGSRPSGTS